jgi:DNA-binding response OmpR family regulator
MKKDVLWVEDDRIYQLLIKETVKSCGFDDINITFLEDGQEYINFSERKDPYQDIKKYPVPDLVILDLQLPKIDGKGILKYIQDSKKNGEKVVIILSGSGYERDICGAYKLGANAFIKKPMSIEGLKDVFTSIEEHWFKRVSLPDCEKNVSKNLSDSNI